MEKPLTSGTQPKRSQILGVRYVRRPLTKRQKIITAVISTIIGAVLIGGLWYNIGYSSRAFINSGGYQAIFTTNNQAYFGKMQRLSDGAYRLNDVYYLQQSGSTAQKPDTTGQTPELVKMGSELHGPEDAIIFPPEQVLFWENLKNDGKVTKAIEDYSKNKK